MTKGRLLLDLGLGAVVAASITFVACSSDIPDSGPVASKPASNDGNDGNDGNDAPAETDGSPGDGGVKAPTGDASSPDGQAPTADGAIGSTGKLAFGQTCAKDNDCQSGTCFIGGSGGGGGAAETYCSVRCSSSNPCPTPLTSGKCNARGYCKR